MPPTWPINNGNAPKRVAQRGRPGLVAGGAVLLAVTMLGASFAAVPLYRMFCEATGFAGTPRRAEAASDKEIDRTVAVRFDSNVSPGLPWSFEPVERQVDLKIGENRLVFFRATNNSEQTITGTATFNVTPDLAAGYFDKVQCFCFQEQTLKPHETVEMPVSFYIDPAIMQDRDAKTIELITLSYTFFRAKTDKASTAAANLDNNPVANGSVTLQR